MVSAEQQRRWDVKPQRLRRPKIDDQLKFRLLFDRKIACFRGSRIIAANASANSSPRRTGTECTVMPSDGALASASLR
jgi:hypothetical protein